LQSLRARRLDVLMYYFPQIAGLGCYPFTEPAVNPVTK
jgi:hypothetical protein